MRRTVFIGSGIFLALMAGGLFFLWRTGGPQPNNLPQLAATVNGVAITRVMVEKEITVNRFNVSDPLPPLSGADFSRAADEALNQLITRQLVLQAASRQNFSLDEALVESRVGLLFGTNNEEVLDNALGQVGVTRTDLVWWVREITTVEEFTINVIMAGAVPEDRQQVYNDWLNAQRAAAEIKTYLNGEEQGLLDLAGQAGRVGLIIDTSEPAGWGERQA